MSIEPRQSGKGSRILWIMSAVVLISAGATFGLWMHRAPTVVLAPSHAITTPVPAVAPLVPAQPTQLAPEQAASPMPPLIKEPEKRRVRVAAVRVKPEAKPVLSKFTDERRPEAASPPTADAAPVVQAEAQPEQDAETQKKPGFFKRTFDRVRHPRRRENVESDELKQEQP